MQKISTKSLNLILAFGMFFLLAGFLFFVGFYGKKFNIAGFVCPLLLSICGFTFLYCYLVFYHRSFFLFQGLTLASWGIFGLLLGRGIIPFTMKEWWPLFLFFSGLAAVFTGRARTKKIKIKYDFPGFFLIILGAIFLFFSFGVTDASFVKIVILIGPLIFIFAGIVLVIVFLYRKEINSIIDTEIEYDSDYVNQNK